MVEIFRKAYGVLAAGALIYISWLCAMTYPTVQRAVLYANLINPAMWEDVNDVENYGFLRTQVQPFFLKTPDNETLYGWHILPLHLCRENEKLLNDNWSYGPADDYTETVAYKLLSEDPNSRIVVNFHGNAAHLGSVIRPEMYRMALGVSTPQNPVHVFAIDYRGFGISTGYPSEEGLITDGVTLLNYLTAGPYNIPPSRIVISGLSLGTAVTTAVAERFAFGATPLNSNTPVVGRPILEDPEPFAGIIIVASFSNIPDLIGSYSFKGLTPPMLAPLARWPRAQEWVKAWIVDTWQTNRRLARLTGEKPRKGDSADFKHAHKSVDITIIHARNDAEIPWTEGFKNWKWATTGKDCDSEENLGAVDGRQPKHGKIVYEHIAENGKSETVVWEKEISSPKGVKRVRWEKVGYGGHNHVGSYSVAALAVLRSFED